MNFINQYLLIPLKLLRTPMSGLKVTREICLLKVKCHYDIRYTTLQLYIIKHRRNRFRRKHSKDLVVYSLKLKFLEK